MKLHQIIAVEKTVKNRVGQWMGSARKAIGKSSLFDGFSKTYEKKDEDGEEFPDDRQLVQFSMAGLLQDIAENMTEYLDLVAAKDDANCRARADVVVDGETIMSDIPATHLLFLEKQLAELGAIADELPVLDPAFDWKHDAAAGVYKSNPHKTTKTKKLHVPIVLYDATEHHPAQTQLVQSDEIIGWWTNVKHSGALTMGQKKTLQLRIRELVKAVKFAREEANEAVTAQPNTGGKLFSYLLKDL